MERYVKANRKVAEFLHLENDRTQFKDGNFLLWMQDIMVFGSLINFNQILAQIGAVALDGDSAKQEQDGEPVGHGTEEHEEVPDSVEVGFAVVGKEPRARGVEQPLCQNGAKRA